MSLPRAHLGLFRRAAVAAITALAVSGIAAPAATAAPPSRTTAATSSTCSVPAPTTAAGWQTAFDNLNNGQWSGADQSASIRLPDNRLLWVFSDTFLGAENADGSRAPGTRMIHNTFVIADRGCLTGVTGPGGTEVVPNTADGQFYWPQHAFIDNGVLFVTAFRVKAIPEAPGFAVTGTFLVRFNYTSGGTPTFRSIHATPASGTADTVSPQWGTAVAQADGYTYLYGTKRVIADWVFGKALYVARVPAGQATTQSAWRYWNGTTWATSASQAREIKPADGGVSTALSIWRHSDGTWRGVTKKHDVFGTEIVLLSSSTPTGPWTETVIGTSPSVGTQVTYNPLAHPEIPLDGGALLVSISRNDSDWAALMADADLYKPQFSQTLTR